MKRRPIVIISGMIAADPHQGGAAWAVLQYLLGFKRLGWDVLFIEPLKPSKLLPAGSSLAESLNARYFSEVLSSFGLLESSALLLQGAQKTFGLDYHQLRSISADAQMLINISGMLTDPELIGRVPIRVYLDLDPAFIQIWHAQGTDMHFAGHTHFLTVGQLIGSPDCPVPTENRHWQHTLPPVVMSHWPPTDVEPTLGLTTVGNFRSYGKLDYQGLSLGLKAHSLRQFIDLPTRLGEPVNLAMEIHESEGRDLQSLLAGGWNLMDPRASAGTPRDYQHFIARSKAELGITKDGYIKSRSGWFSDRSACYLASGRPVIAQETGWSAALPTGAGLFAFATPEEAVAAVREINADPIKHRRAARAIAEDYFDSDRVLKRLLSMVGAK
jgi:hypothetical protein